MRDLSFYLHQYRNNLSYLVARTFKDAKSGKVYFVNPFPRERRAIRVIRASYPDNLQDILIPEFHLNDAEVPFSEFAQSRPLYITPLRRIDAMRPGYSEPND